MKVSIASGGFKPVDLNITLESEDEVGAFFAIFNHGDILDSVPFDGEVIRDALKKAAGGNIGYRIYHDKLTKSFTDNN